MSSPTLDKNNPSPNIPLPNCKYTTDSRETFKEYMERRYGKQAVLEHPDLISLFVPVNFYGGESKFMRPNQKLPSLELLELAFGNLTNEELQQPDIENSLYKKLFFGDTFLIPPSLHQSQRNDLIDALHDFRKNNPSHPNVPRPRTGYAVPHNKVHQMVRSHLNYKCHPSQDCLRNFLDCLDYSMKPPKIQRPPEESPDHLFCNSKYAVDFVHPCLEYTEFFKAVHTAEMIERLDHHNGTLLVPETRTPKYYNYINRLLKDHNYGTIATYRACCKHRPFLWTKMGDESMPEKYYRYECRICNHGYVSPDGKVCKDCIIKKVLQKWDCKKEYGIPLMSHIRYCCPGGLRKDLVSKYSWKNEDGVWYEIPEPSMSEAGMNSPYALFIQTG